MSVAVDKPWQNTQIVKQEMHLQQSEWVDLLAIGENPSREPKCHELIKLNAKEPFEIEEDTDS